MHGGELTEKKRVGMDAKTHVSQCVCKDDVTKFSLCACVRAKFRELFAHVGFFLYLCLLFSRRASVSAREDWSDMGAVITPSERVYND